MVRRPVPSVLLLGLALAMLAALSPPPASAQGEEPTTDVGQGVTRINGDPLSPGDVRAIAINACRTVLPDPGTARQVLLSRDDAFADALAGSGLAGPDSCVLYTEGGQDGELLPAVRDELDRVLPDGGHVLLLGGENAVSPRVEDDVVDLGYDVTRFAGPTRYETAAQLAEAVRAEQDVDDPAEAVLAFGGGWADAVTGGAYAAAQGTPVLLTPTDELHPAARAFLDAEPLDRTWVVGGTAVVSPTVEQAVPNPVRISGPNRMATAVAIAEQMWPTVPDAGDRFVFVNLEHPQGWTLALAAVPFAASIAAPELGVRTDQLPDETRQHVLDQGFQEVPDAVLVGDLTFIDEQVADEVEDAIRPVECGEPRPTGELTLRDLPPSVQEGELESDDEIFLLPERVGDTLSDDVAVNAVPDGTEQVFENGSDLADSVVPQGTTFNSFLIHFDRVGRGDDITQVGEVTFASDILGIIVRQGELNASDDVAGGPGTAYDTASRDLEFGGTDDRVTIGADRRTLTMELTTNVAVDQMRVLTAACP